MISCNRAKVFKKTVFLGLLALFFSVCLCYAGTITVQLIFPSKNGAPVSAPNPIQKPVEVSGTLIVDIAPYPGTGTVENDRYLVEYFLDDQLLFKTTGLSEDAPEEASFKYVLDTSRFENGRYKLVVNFWDSMGDSAIGIKEIVINNPENE